MSRVWPWLLISLALSGAAALAYWNDARTLGIGVAAVSVLCSLRGALELHIVYKEGEADPWR